MPCKIESSDKPEISQEGENIFYGKHLLTINADFALQLEITRNLNLISIYIQSVVTTRDLVESGWQLPYLQKAFANYWCCSHLPWLLGCESSMWPPNPALSPLLGVFRSNDSNLRPMTTTLCCPTVATVTVTITSQSRLLPSSLHHSPRCCRRRHLVTLLLQSPPWRRVVTVSIESNGVGVWYQRGACVQSPTYIK